VTLPRDKVSCGASGGRIPGSLKPILVCVPSQKGLSFDIPQRHSTKVAGEPLVDRVPARTTSPDTTFGPSGRTRSTVVANAPPFCSRRSEVATAGFPVRINGGVG
jgi:hypothetical protein